MGEDDYVLYLSGNDEMRVRIFTERGRVIRFTVQHEAYIDDRWYRVVHL